MARKVRLKELDKVEITWRVVEMDAKTLKVLRDTTSKNVITSLGLNMMAKAMANFGNGAIAPAYPTGDHRFEWRLKLGTGAGTPAAADEELFGPIATSLHSGTVSYVSGNTYQYYVRYLPEEANGYTYTECGIFDEGQLDSAEPHGFINGKLFNHLMLSPTLAKDDTKLVDFYITVAFN